MTPLRRTLIVALALAVHGESASAAEAAKPQVMLGGTFHFSSPGRDLKNVKAVDIQAADWQRQIGKVITALARFASTQGVVEWPANVVDERYAKFRDGTLPARARTGQ